MSLLPFLAALAAFLLFALATDGHHRRRWGTPCPAARAKVLRSAGWTLLAAGLPGALMIWGPVIGPIGWVGAIMAGAAATFCLLNFGLSNRS